MTMTVEMLHEELEEIFPEIGEIALTPDTQLFEIPDWDSMSSVNLQVFLEESFNVAVTQNFLNDDTKISDIIALADEKTD